MVLAMVITIAFLVGIVFGRGEQSQVAQEEAAPETTQEAQSQAETTENSVQKATPASNEIPPTGAVAELGQTVRFPDRTFTVNDIQRGYTFPNNIPKPKVGNEFIIANVTITNTSSQPIKVNSYNFESEDSSGVRLRAQATQVPPDIIFLSSVAPNGELTGNLIFEVAQGDPTIRIVHRPQ